MAERDIVVIGGSAGAIPPLVQVVEALPANFSASIFIVIHVPPYSPNALPQILSRAGALTAVLPDDGEAIRPGRIYVAAPDHHLLLERGRVLVKRGPKENRFRPSIDALFRSAAYEYGDHVVGVLLSGVLDDGVSGLWTINRMGGLTVIQDPVDAVFPDMPANARRYVKVDYSAPASEIAQLLVRLTQAGERTKPKPAVQEMKRLKAEVLIAARDNAFEMGIIEMGKLTPFTCPECHGALTRLKEGKIIRFRCHTGHAFTISALLSEVSESVEELLWQAMRGLEESNMLMVELGKYFEEAEPAAAEVFFKKAEELKSRARIVHDSVLKQELVSGDLRFDKGRVARRRLKEAHTSRRRSKARVET